MNPDDFEKRLQSQPMRQIPGEWRKKILEGAQPAPHSSFVSRHSFLSTLLWPNPKAWAGLAAVWVVILALQFGSRKASPMMAMTPTHSTSETMMAIKDQQKILAELIENVPPREMDKPGRVQPRSELREPFSMA
jgi:hypothetical protein